MADLIGEKQSVYTVELPATNFHPPLKLSDFQLYYGYLDDQNEQSIKHQMTIDKAMVDRQLKPLETLFKTLELLSTARFSNADIAKSIYHQAVFALTASNLIANKVATDATKDAASRADSLETKAQHLLAQSRQAIDQLLQTNSGYTFEVI